MWPAYAINKGSAAIDGSSNFLLFTNHNTNYPCISWQAQTQVINTTMLYTHTLQGTSRTSSTNPSNIMKQMDANAALYSTSHWMIKIVHQSIINSSTDTNNKMWMLNIISKIKYLGNNKVHLHLNLLWNWSIEIRLPPPRRQCQQLYPMTRACTENSNTVKIKKEKNRSLMICCSLVWILFYHLIWQTLKATSLNA